MSLTVVKTDDGIELVIDFATGEAFATQAGYVRMSNKAKSTISERCSVRLDGGNSDIIDAQVMTEAGLRSVRLIPARTVGKWLIKDKPALAEAMIEAGATMYMLRLAGYQIKVEPINPQPQPQPVAHPSAIPPRMPRVFQETAEISEHQLRAFCFLRDLPDRWFTSKEVAEGAGISWRTARFYCKYFLDAGFLDMHETFPGHTYRFSAMAEARNASIYKRLHVAIEAVGNPLARLSAII